MSERERAEQDGIERVHRLVAEAVAILSPLIAAGQRGLVMRAALPVEGDAPQVCQWREIATAPNDGTRVLVMWEYWSADPFVAYFKHGKWNGEVALSECSDDGPTHWMPLPVPPVALVPAEWEK